MQRLNFHHSFAHCGPNSQNEQRKLPSKLKIAFKTFLHTEGSFELKISQKASLLSESYFL